MSARDREGLRRRMGELAALPVDDPQRRKLEAAIAREGDWAEKEWHELPRFDEWLRIELRRGPEPAGLKERLLAIPDEARLPRRSLVRGSMVAAAALLLVCAGLMALFMSGRDPAQRIREIGLAAVGDHMAGQHLMIETSDGPSLIAALRSQMHFDLKLPHLGDEFQLLGGRKCAFGQHPVLYTRWRRGEYEYSLYQFCPKDFGLPSDFSKRTVVPDNSRAARRCTALMWTEDGCAYVLVAERDAVVPSLASALKRGLDATHGRALLVFGPAAASRPGRFVTGWFRSSEIARAGDDRPILKIP